MEEEEIGYDDIPTIAPVEDGTRHYTNPTIWVGVLPDTLSGAVAHESAKDIRTFLDELQSTLTSIHDRIGPSIVAIGRHQRGSGISSGCTIAKCAHRRQRRAKFSSIQPLATFQ